MNPNEEPLELSSIIILGETGTGKSTFINNLCQKPKCKVGLGLESETEEVMGINCDGEFNDIFMIDTPGLNDSNGEERDEKNIYLMNDFIKNHPRIKGIIILLKFTDNKLTGSIKKSLKIFYNMFPINNFWSHVIIIFSHFYDMNHDEKIKRKNKLIENYEKEFKKIMEQSKIEHKNFILPEGLKMYFCELKNPDKETKKEIKKGINYLKIKEKMFKKIEEKIEKPKIGKTIIEGNVTFVEYYIEKITIFTDFDDSKKEIRKVIEKWKETFIEEKEIEVKKKKEGEKTIIEHYIFKKIIHKNKNNEEKVNIDKENPLEKFIEIEEMIYLPEEIDEKTEGNVTTYTHKFYKQMKYIDKNLNETFGKKIFIKSYITSKEEIEVEPVIQENENIKVINYRKKNKLIDKDGNITFEEPKIYKTDTHITKVEHHYKEIIKEVERKSPKESEKHKSNGVEITEEKGSEYIQEEEDEDFCEICFDSHKNEKSVILPCNHKVYKCGFLYYINQEKRCPYCGYDLTGKNYEDIFGEDIKEKEKDSCSII